MRSANADKLATLISNYAISHQNHRNEIIHCFCVPAILFSVVGILFVINFGITLIVIAAAILYYNRLSQKAAIQMGAVLMLMLLMWMLVMPSHHIIAISLSIFVIAWAGQFVGHVYEGAKHPSPRIRNPLLITPLFVLNVLRSRVFRALQPDPQ